MYFTFGACIGGPLRLSIKESDLPLQRGATRFLNARIACSVGSPSPIALAAPAMVGGWARGLGLPSSGTATQQSTHAKHHPSYDFELRIRLQRRSACSVSLVRRSFPSSPSFQMNPTRYELLL